MTVTGREQEGNFWGDGNILYLVWGSGDMILCIYQNSLNCALKICANHCTSFYLFCCCHSGKFNKECVYIRSGIVSDI